MRLLTPEEIEGIFMLFTAIIGLAVNITSILILHGSQKEDLNIKGVFYHMIGDAISSVAVVFTSFIIYYTNYSYLDPILSFLISLLIISWAIKILKESGRILLEMTPKGLDINIIEKDLKNTFIQIVEINHTHLWTITSELLILTTHLQLIKDKIDEDKFINDISYYLYKKYNIIESTIQISFSNEIRGCEM